MDLVTVEKLNDRRDGNPHQRPTARFQSKAVNKPQPTPADRLEAKKKKDERREKYAAALAAAQDIVWKQAEALREEFGGHDVNYYFEEIIQRGHLTLTQRAPSRWNAFVKMELEEKNSRLPEGAVLYKSNQIVGECSKKWKAMSEEERIAITDDEVKKLALRKEANATAPHNVSLNSFHDVRANIEVITKELTALNARTGTEILLVAVRSTASAFNRPFFFHTSDTIAEFFSLTFKLPLGEIVGKLECFCLSGVQGMLSKHESSFVELKTKTAALIASKLEHLLGAKTRMNYVNFDTAITEKHGVIVKNWPLSIFVSPGDIRTFTELKVLHSAWSTGTAYFHRLSKQEFEVWSSARSQPTTKDPLPPPPSPAEGNVPTSPDEPTYTSVFQSYGVNDITPGTQEDSPANTEPQPISLEDRAPANLCQDENLPLTPSVLAEKRPNSEEASAPSKKKRRQGLTEFVNMIVPSSGGPVIANKKPRKVRSDKDKKRTPKQLPQA